MFAYQELEEKLRIQEENVKLCEASCREIFEMLGRSYFKLEERPEIPELEEILKAAQEKWELLECEVGALEQMKEAYLDMKKNTCLSCGERMKVERAKFCYNCGAPMGKEPMVTMVDEQIENKKPEVSFCKNCDQELKPEARFCGKCGTPVV